MRKSRSTRFHTFTPDEPQRETPMLTVVPQVHASRGGVPLRRKQSGVYSTQVVETQDEENEGEQFLEENEAFCDELEVEHRP